MDDRRRDGGTNSTLRIKEQGMYLTLKEHDDDDDDDDECGSAPVSESHKLQLPSLRLFRRLSGEFQ